MVAHPLRIVSVFSGVGGLDAGLGLALDCLGVPHRHELYVEREVAAARLLAARFADGSLDPAPVWSDVRSIPDIGDADLLCGGFPCQDISTAGKGEGLHGSRSGLFFDMLDAAVRLGCRYLFLENVAAITARGLDTVLGSLAEAGFDAEWCHLSLAELGFPQKRERWFCLAFRRDCMDDASGGRNGQPDGEVRAGRDSALDAGGPAAAYAGGERSQGLAQAGPAARATRRGDRAEVDDSAGSRRDGAGERSSAVEQGGERLPGEGCPHLYPPGPSDAEAWGWVLERWPRLAPAVNPSAVDVVARARRLYRLLAPGRNRRERGRASRAAFESALRRVATGAADRVDIARADRLRALGNLATPAQSAVAFYELWQRVHG